jgi:hypothetical protein
METYTGSNLHQTAHPGTPHVRIRKGFRTARALLRPRSMGLLDSFLPALLPLWAAAFVAGFVLVAAR